MTLPQDSPVERRCKELPQGDGNWPGFDVVYRNLARAAEAMGANPHIRCSADHVEVMATMGCGHEETMKYRQLILRSQGWIK